jgi:hypothetical protein
MIIAERPSQGSLPSLIGSLRSTKAQPIGISYFTSNGMPLNFQFPNVFMVFTWRRFPFGIERLGIMGDQRLDCMGLACPQPVLKVKEVLDRGEVTRLTVAVDNEAARENVSRFMGRMVIR